MKNNGQVEITSYTQPMQRFSAVSESGYQSLTALRELCIKNDDNEFGEQNYILNTINAVYDESGNMMLEIPLYAKGDENSPNRIVWYLIYCDDEYKLDSIMSSVKNKNPINDNCFICSKSHSLS